MKISVVGVILVTTGDKKMSREFLRMSKFLSIFAPGLLSCPAEFTFNGDVLHLIFNLLSSARSLSGVNGV
jgi:hypothetical protein